MEGRNKKLSSTLITVQPNGVLVVDRGDGANSMQGIIFQIVRHHI